MASHRCARTEAIRNKDVMESFIAMARAVREQAAATTLMAQQMANKNGIKNSNRHGNGDKDEYMRFVEFCKVFFVTSPISSKLISSVILTN